MLRLILTIVISVQVAATSPIAPREATPTEGEPAVLVGAGDIATCTLDSDSDTAALLDGIDGTVFTLGDNVYDDGTAQEFADCYDPTWGRHRARTFPSPGNHDYETEGATGYFGYFGAAAGEPRRGYYSYDLGAWHVVVLNSNCGEVGGCDADSEQAAWLRDDLTSYAAGCSLAYWHHPRFSSGPHGGTLEMAPLWAILDEAGAEVVLSGHDHAYERFAPQDAAGRAEPGHGIRQFTVGTGGASLYELGEPTSNSEVRDDESFGVLKLTLHEDRYDWEFVPAADGTFTDSGTNACH